MKQPEYVNIGYNNFYIKNKKLYLIYEVHTDSKEDISKLIIKLIPKEDRKYIKLDKWNKNKAVFVFDEQKWLSTESTSKPTETRFKERKRIAKLPSVILNNINSVNYTYYIESILKNELSDEKNGKLFGIDYGRKVASQVKIQYDSNSNSIFYTLKPQFRQNIMSSLATKKKPKEFKRMGFDDSVCTYLKGKKVFEKISKNNNKLS